MLTKWIGWWMMSRFGVGFRKFIRRSKINWNQFNSEQSPSMRSHIKNAGVFSNCVLDVHINKTYMLIFHILPNPDVCMQIVRLTAISIFLKGFWKNSFLPGIYWRVAFIKRFRCICLTKFSFSLSLWSREFDSKNISGQLRYRNFHSVFRRTTK